VAVQHQTTAKGFAADIEIPGIANADLGPVDQADNCDFQAS
jgi:hypothetical protein